MYQLLAKGQWSQHAMLSAPRPPIAIIVDSDAGSTHRDSNRYDAWPTGLICDAEC